MHGSEGNWMIFYATNFTDKRTFVVECLKINCEINYFSILMVMIR